MPMMTYPEVTFASSVSSKMTESSALNPNDSISGEGSYARDDKRERHHQEKSLLIFSSTACGERSLPRLIIVVQFVKKTSIHCETRIPDAVSITIKEALYVIDPIGECIVSYSL